MNDMLSPEEIEALLSSLTSEERATDDASIERHISGGRSHSRRSESSGGREVQLYDFRRPDKLSKEQVRTIQMLHENFSRHASGAFAALLRTPIHIELTSIEQKPYEEYLKSINHSLFTILSLSPLTGQAIFEIEFELLFSMIDKMLGGFGKAIKRTALTDIERPLATELIHRVLNALKTAWEAVAVIQPKIEVPEASAQFLNIVPSSEIVIVMLFELKVGNQKGMMSLCIPYLVLKPIAVKLATQKWTTLGQKENPVTKEYLSAHVCKTSVHCSVRLGTTKLKMRDFIRLEPGDVLILDQTVEEDAFLHIGDFPKFTGRAVRIGKKLGFQITGKIKE
ncbi:MAG TPA: flagellar motor switch protein FliM [Fimbriimonadales bacterium]|nr:flagellar motor switch protein FliM [Fimbriimonadales bacterium]